MCLVSEHPQLKLPNVFISVITKWKPFLDLASDMGVPWDRGES